MMATSFDRLSTKLIEKRFGAPALLTRQTGDTFDPRTDHKIAGQTYIILCNAVEKPIERTEADGRIVIHSGALIKGATPLIGDKLTLGGTSARIIATRQVVLTGVTILFEVIVEA